MLKINPTNNTIFYCAVCGIFLGRNINRKVTGHFVSSYSVVEWPKQKILKNKRK